MVGIRPGLRLGRGLRRERLGQGDVERRRQESLGGGGGSGSQARELRRHHGGLAGQGGRRHDARNQPDPQRLLGSDRVAEQRHLRGSGRADEARQRPGRPAVRDETDPPECEYERGTLRRDSKIAGEGK